MTQADGRSKLERMALRLKMEGKKDRVYHFAINPQDYEETFPQRTITSRTREAVVVEDFGPDIAGITFSGTTGFTKIGGKSGAQRMFELEKLLNEYARSGFTTEPRANPNKAELIFYNYTDGKSWYVHLAEDGFNITRTAEESLLYRYTISLVVLREATEPDRRNIDGARLGNPIPAGKYQTTTYYANQVINPRTSEGAYKDAAGNIKDIVGTDNSVGGVTMLPD